MSADPVTIARDLLRCRSVTPAEGGALQFLEATLKAAGFTVHRTTFSEPGTDDVENLYARIGSGTPNLMFAGHTDVVPPGDEQAWQQPPFSGAVDDGELYGRGAVDMKGGIACAVAAVLDHLSHHGGRPKGSISFLISGDEEGIAVNGTPKLLKWAADHGEKFDHCILGEPSNVEELGDTIKIGRRGSLNGHLIVTGRQGHVAYPERAENPIRGLVTIIAALQAEPLDAGSAHFPPSHLEFTSVDVGNKTVNLIPGEARARFNIRFNDRHTLELAENTDRAACRQGRRRQRIRIPVGIVKRRRVRHRVGSIHRAGVRRGRHSHRPQAEIIDDRRHLGCAFHHALLPGGGIRVSRPDHASSERAGTDRRPARAHHDLSDHSRSLLRLTRRTERRLRTGLESDPLSLNLQYPFVPAKAGTQGQRAGFPLSRE